MLWCCTLMYTVEGQETIDIILTMNKEKFSQWEWLSPGRGSPKICQVYIGETQAQWTRSLASWSAFKLVLLGVNPALHDLQRYLFPALIISMALWLYGWFPDLLFQWTNDSSWNLPRRITVLERSFFVGQNFGKRCMKSRVNAMLCFYHWSHWQNKGIRRNSFVFNKMLLIIFHKDLVYHKKHRN